MEENDSGTEGDDADRADEAASLFGGANRLTAWIKSGIAGSEADEGASRWSGVVDAGYEILSRLRQLSDSVSAEADPEFVGDLLDELRDETGRLLEAVPPAVEVVDDLEALEAKLQALLERDSDRTVIGAYLGWLESLAERVIEHLVRRTFSTEKRRPIADTETMIEWFGRFETIVDQIVSRWVVDETIETADPRNRGES